ncbi:MAG: PAS domain S-box protein [Gammaproteobacteria bacterium]
MKTALQLPLAARITLVLLAVIAVAAAGLGWFGQQVVLEKFAETEMQLVRQNRTILDRVIGSEVEHLQAIATDWGQWDDLYDFLQGSNPDFETSELGNVVLDRLELDVILLIEPSGRLFYGDLRPEAESGEPEADAQAAAGLAALLTGSARRGDVTHPARKSLLPAASSRETLAGLMDTPRGPMVLSLRAVSRTDGSGDAAGTLVMGRYLHAEKLFTELSVLPSHVIPHGSGRERMSDEMHVLARELVNAPSGSRLVTRQDDMSDFKIFGDLAGNPAFMLETRMPRSIVATGRDTAQLLLVGVLVTAALTILILLALIRGVVSAPLRRLTGHMLALREGAEMQSTPGISRNDEIGTLARRFDELVSARQQAQVRLEIFAAAVEHAGDAIAILDADGTINYVNPQYERQTGFSRAEVIGKAPGRGHSAGTTYDELWQTVRSGRTWSGMLQTSVRDGAVRYEEVTVAPIKDAAGHVTSFIAVMRDITARRETEAELRNLSAVVESTAECITVLDADGRIQYVNPAYERNRGVSSADVVGRAPGEVIKGRDDPAHYHDMWQTVTQGRTWTGRVTTELNDGRVVTEEAVVSPVVTDGGRPGSYVIILHDVTGRIRLEEQLAQARKLEAVGQLAAGVAHEINTPTQYVGGNIRFLRDAFTSVTALLGDIARLVRGASGGSVPAADLARVLAAADVDYLQAEVPVAIRQSLEGVERVGEIVKSMRELTHPAREFALTDLNRVVESAVRVAGSEWQGLAELSTELDPGLPPVPCLAGGINQVIVNMLVNAAHAIEARGGAQPGRILVATRQSGDSAEIRITDNGAGMSDEVRARVFDPFFTTKEVGQGTGQGLAIAHSVVKKHGGSISVDSERGRGATFTIRLPLDPVRDSRRASGGN